MIDPYQEVYFYDDRNKDTDLLKLTEIKFYQDGLCLCIASWVSINEHELEICRVADQVKEIILFNTETHEVLNGDFQFWLAHEGVPSFK